MSIDLSQAVAAEMMVNRLNLTDAAILVFEESDPTTGYADRISLPNDGTKDWDATEVENVQNKNEFYSIRVLDYDGFEALANKCDSIKLEGYRYKIETRFPPKGATRIWLFRCARTGERS